MASTETSRSAARSRYAGSLLSILSKSEMRYEGVLYHVDTQDAVLGLKNVRSFGTEGRRKDGPQVLPDDRVFDYIQFRGSDIKDLQVLSSPSPPSAVTSSLPDDPAIIKSGFLFSPSTSTSISQSASRSLANNSSSGLPKLTLQEIIPSYPSPQNLTPFSAFLPPISSLANGQSMPSQGQEFGTILGEVPFVQQQSSLVELPPNLAAYHMKQQLQHPAMSTPTTSSAAAYQFSHSFTPSVSVGSLSSTPFYLHADLPSSSALLASSALPNGVVIEKHNVLPSVPISSSLALLSLTSPAGVNINSIPQGIHGSTGLPKENVPQATLWVRGSSNAVCTEDLKPSLDISCQNSQTDAQPLTSSHFSGSSHRDVQVVKALTPESLSIGLRDAQVPILPLPEPSAEKLKSISLDASYSPDTNDRGKNAMNRVNVQDHIKHVSNMEEREKTNQKDAMSMLAEGRKKVNRVDSQALQVSWSSSAERKKTMTKAQSKTCRDTNISEKGGNRMAGADREDHQASKSISVGRGMKWNGAANRLYRVNKGMAWGRGQEAFPPNIPHFTAKYAKDFDFVTMNKKFNKDEVWGELDKLNKAQLKVKDACVVESVEAEHVDAMKHSDIKPGYVKDDFFDTLLTDPPRPGRGRTKLSDQRKLDEETIGYSQRHRTAYGTQTTSSRGGKLRGSSDGKQYNNAGRRG